MKTRSDNDITQKTNVPPLGGEGDKQADRNYREGVQRTVEGGDIDEMTADGVEAFDDEETRKEGLEAEAAGKARSKGEDPRLLREAKEAKAGGKTAPQGDGKNQGVSLNSDRFGAKTSTKN